MTVHAFTVYDMIATGAVAHGDAPAVIHGGGTLSFRDFRRRVDALAGGLHALGLGKGDRVCILAQNDPAYLELYGACARQGIIAYPINWRLTAEEVERVLERAAPAMMVVDASTLSVVAGWPERKTSIAHWYQFGKAAGAGFTPFAALYRAVLTAAGQAAARSLIRAHRLWESYLDTHFDLPRDHLHDAAERMEHFLGTELQEELAAELADRATDPHGKAIPPATSPSK
jgi:acyl-CoA synthetase (AMP-forming)/AMP-acid ligase II